MCGILGSISLSVADPTAFKLENGLASIRHRGPDDQGTWRDTYAALGMVRLSIVDIAGGHQPMVLDDGRVVIVFNGEIYNHAALRRELQARGRVFQTSSDTEVVLHAVDLWGVDALSKFNGMFAFAVWWPLERRALIARDGLGEKPLYVRRVRGGVSFASEMKALLAAEGCRVDVDKEGLANYLRFGHAVGRTTMVAGIEKLLPGHCLVIDETSIVERRWFTLSTVPDIPDVPCGADGRPAFAACADVVRELLAHAVELRMVADVPVGAFLSGGVDSSAVVALMARHSRERVKTFSIGFDDDGYDESANARAVAAALGTEHHELRVAHVDLIKTLETLVHHYDEPFADSAGLPLLLLSRFARERVKVALTGDGSDEIFGGYRRYVADQAAPLWGRLPRAVVEATRAIARHSGRARRFRRALEALPERNGGARQAAWLEILSTKGVETLTRPYWRAAAHHDPARTMREAWAELCAPSFVDDTNRALFTDLQVWLPDAYTEKVDKASMAASLEARLPFLDVRLAAFAFRLPGTMKVRGRETKRVLKAAVKGIIPAEVLKRPKRGFAVPTDPWFRGPLKTWARARLLDGGARVHDLLERSAILQLWNEHERGVASHDEALWALLNLECWLQGTSELRSGS